MLERRIRADVVEKFLKLQVVYDAEATEGEQSEEGVLESLRPKEQVEMQMSTGEELQEEEESRSRKMSFARQNGDSLSRSQRRAVDKKKKKKLF